MAATLALALALATGSAAAHAHAPDAGFVLDPGADAGPLRVDMPPIVLPPDDARTGGKARSAVRSDRLRVVA